MTCPAATQPLPHPAAGDGGDDTDPLSVANRLRPVLLHISRHLRRETDPLGVTGGQASLLAAIRDHPGIGVSELAAREGMSPPTLCVHIDRLEAAGLVARTRGEGPDRRRVGLSITGEGGRQLAETRSRRTAWLAEGLRALSPEQLRHVAEAVEPLRLLADAPAARSRAGRARPVAGAGPIDAALPDGAGVAGEGGHVPSHADAASSPAVGAIGG